MLLNNNLYCDNECEIKQRRVVNVLIERKNDTDTQVRNYQRVRWGSRIHTAIIDIDN